ncbi:pilus assembly FimT family protein [Ruegeria halocynthiae]|uniref:pilus assembly FimT family protein n=1 Tax=Ruegeria halocynthiae TaxID=985054 RepID=UPI000569EDB5|nr:prepilin-type N-terminal cleavage/methylation domain-containing protein [Ruegeria halocynthiae]
MLHSDGSLRPSTPTRSTGGFSLFEVLIVLSILAMVVAISATGFRPPSDEMRLNGKVSELASRTSEARLQAIRSNQPVGVELTDCNGELLSLGFYPDGTATGVEICLAEGARQENLILSPLTGQVSMGKGNE